MRQNVGLNCRQTSRKNHTKSPYLRPESKVETQVKFQQQIGATTTRSKQPTWSKIPLTAGLEIVVFLPSIWMQTFAAISRSLSKLKEDIFFSLKLHSRSLGILYTGVLMNGKIKLTSHRYISLPFVKGPHSNCYLDRSHVESRYFLPLGHFSGYDRQVKSTKVFILFGIILTLFSLRFSHSRACAHFTDRFDVIGSQISSIHLLR